MKVFIRIVFIFCLFYSFCENTESATNIYESYGESVVYIQQALYLNSSNVKNRELFEKLEKGQDIKILDTYKGLGSGSGFFITSDGYIITNHHVVENTTVENFKRSFFFTLYTDIERKNKVLSGFELNTLYNALKQLIDKSVFSYRVQVGNKDFYEAKLITSDKDIDLALLKINSKQIFSPAPIGDSETLKVGSEVIAIGYPLPSSLLDVVKDFSSTMTKGYVSSIRNDNWGIQHTSSINFGNSGGPLFNMMGEVIGINVGLMLNANDMYFSIPTKS